jgi:uncharacterized protein YgiM (DUF1202 family)
MDLSKSVEHVSFSSTEFEGSIPIVRKAHAVKSWALWGTDGTWDDKTGVFIITEKVDKPPLLWYIDDKGVRLRSGAGLDAGIIRTLKEGEEVQVCDVLERMDNLDETHECWYKIKTKNNETGWVYGAYLEAPPEPQN